MKAALVTGPGKAPVFADFQDPRPAPGEVLVSVAAAAISQVAKSRASGTHYSSDGRFPFIDGVGRAPDGSRVYFVLPEAPFGAMAEKVAIAAERCMPVPDGLDDITAAALANPGMSSWAAFTERARLRPGETVLVNGATGTSGRLAVQIAKHLGAGKVIATGRDPAALAELAGLGADVALPLGGDLEERAMPLFAEGIDVVIDYLWGESARTLLIAAAKAGPEARPIRFVQIGSISGGDISLPAAVLRSSAIDLMGSGIGSVPADRLIACIGDLLEAAPQAGFKIAVTPTPLPEVERAWPKDDSRQRTVFLIGDQK
jgi:NADPH:quinone reductase-like Zn-dependent oxidoreductase